MRASWTVLAAWLLVTPLPAEETAPEMALLEFLGSFETADGQWLDPTLFETPPPTPTSEQTEPETEGQDNS